jgi:hypothetical protein
VLPVAQEVEAILGRSTVFYDDWYTHWIAGTDADLLLQGVYGKQAELVVVCVSGAYGDKPWTHTEHRAVRARFQQAATAQDRLRVLPVRVGDGEVEGVLFNEIVPDIRNKSPTEAAELIVARLNLARSDAASAHRAGLVPADRRLAKTARASLWSAIGHCSSGSSLGHCATAGFTSPAYPHKVIRRLRDYGAYEDFRSQPPDWSFRTDPGGTCNHGTH